MNAVIQTGYVIETTYVNGIAVCEINSDMSPNLTYTGFFQYLQPGILCNIPNNTKVALAFSPHKHVGSVIGAVNIIPEDNTTLSDVPSASPPIKNSLQPGEVALVNIANFNYSIQAKVDRLVAIFDNGNKNSPFTTSTLIGETIVLILLDIIKEFNVVADKLTNHVHNAGPALWTPGGDSSAVILGSTGIAVMNPTTPPIIPPTTPTPIPVVAPYSPTTKLVSNDNDYLSKAECYVDSKGLKDIP